jgi:hypothetical protein
MAKPAKLSPPNSTGSSDDGGYDDMYGSNWLSPDDVKKNFYAISKRQERQTFSQGGKGEKDKVVIFFDGIKKGLVLNKTNAGSLASVYGKPPANWVGKRILIKREMTNFQGKPTPCIRIYPADGDDMSGDGIPY